MPSETKPPSRAPHLPFLIESSLWNADEQNFCLLIDLNRVGASSETAKIIIFHTVPHHTAAFPWPAMRHEKKVQRFSLHVRTTCTPGHVRYATTELKAQFYIMRCCFPAQWAIWFSHVEKSMKRSLLSRVGPKAETSWKAVRHSADIKFRKLRGKHSILPMLGHYT